MKYEIFGKNIEINTTNKEIKLILQEELSLYKKSNNQSDIEIYIVDYIEKPKYYSNSPKIHTTYKNGFSAIFGHNEIFFKKEDKLKIYIKLKDINEFVNKINKFKNMGYKSNIENITAILYELILVPLNYFEENRALVHASSMKNLNSGKTIMFGGTGGVGKTSLELLLCRDLGYSFISDDIAIIDDKGFVYPNLAYPKIYAYNAEGTNIENILFENRTYIDKLQWILSKNLRGLNKARRTIAPNKIYSSVETTKNKIDEYYILSKNSQVKEIEIEEVDFIQASLMTLKVILNEYHSFNQHIIWHEYNSILLSQNPILKLNEVTKSWLELYQNILKNIKCFNIKIPIDIEHEKFLTIFKERFENA